MSCMHNPPHPGSILQEELKVLGISAREFARHIGVAPSTVTRVLKAQSPITPDMAVKISAAINGPTPSTWLGMQAAFDVWQAERRIDISTIKKMHPKVGDNLQADPV